MFGSRMLSPSDALRGGMPLYKFVGNRILTVVGKYDPARANLSEFHSGYRIYATRALASIPLSRNSNGFHFDTEIIIQLLLAGLQIKELPIPTYYGDEICHVNGMSYAAHVIRAALQARLQQASLFYDPKFDCAGENGPRYQPKLNFPSPHSFAYERVRPGSRVLDIGCAGGDLGAYLARTKDCVVDAIDAVPVNEPALRSFYLQDLNRGLPALDYGSYNYVLMLDVLEHLASPERFLESLRDALGASPSTEVIVSTANVAFFVTRMMLFIGQFNYGKRGILDLTHTRLFTFGSFERTITQAGFDILEREGVPGPIPLALGDNRFSRFLLRVNRGLISISRRLFSYQIFLRIKPRPSLEFLLSSAQEYSRVRAEKIDSEANRMDALAR